MTTKVQNVPANVSAPAKSDLATKEIPLHWSEIHWFDAENTRVASSWGNPFSDFVAATRALKDEESDDDRTHTGDGLVLRLLDGWETNKQAYVEVTAPTAEQLKKAHAERRAKLDSWAKDKDELLNQLSKFVEPIWFPNGKPCEIRAIGNMCFRRGRALPGVAYARSLRSKKGEFYVPCLFREYASDKDKFLAHIGENFGKDAGRSKYSPLDEMMLAIRFAEYPNTREADLVRQGMKRGAAQKAWRFAQLNRKLRSAKLAERCQMQATTGDDGRYTYAPGGYIPYKSLDKEELGRLYDGREPFKGERKQTLTTKSFESYLQEVMTGGNRERMLSQKELRHYEGDKLDALRFLAQCIRTGNKEAIAALTDRHGDKLNEACGKIVKWEELTIEFFPDDEEGSEETEE